MRERGDGSKFLLHAQDWVRVNADLRRKSARATQGLVQQNASGKGVM